MQHYLGNSGADDLQQTTAVQEVAEYIADKVASGVLVCPTGGEFIASLG